MSSGKTDTFAPCFIPHYNMQIKGCAMGYYAGWRPEKEKVMGLVFSVNSDQELREKMESGYMINRIREYFEKIRDEESLPFGCVEDHISRDNATDYVVISSNETSIDHQTFAKSRPGKLVEDLRELIQLAYDQVFFLPVEDTPEAPEQDTPAQHVDDRFFQFMHGRFLEEMDKSAQNVLTIESEKEKCFNMAKFEYGRIDGVISYLFLSGAIDVDKYEKLKDQVLDSYLHVLGCALNQGVL